MYIYFLKLQDNKFYIGKTNNPSKRLHDHEINKGSMWTKKYSPIEIVDIVKTDDPFDEDKYTLKYMEKYGIDNVRGGSFTTIVLDESTMKHINKMIVGSTDKCYKCHKEGHFAKECEVFTLKEEIKMLKQMLNKETKDVSIQCNLTPEKDIIVDSINSIVDIGSSLIKSIVDPVYELKSIVDPVYELKFKEWVTKMTDRGNTLWVVSKRMNLYKYYSATQFILEENKLGDKLKGILISRKGAKLIYDDNEYSVYMKTTEQIDNIIKSMPKDISIGIFDELVLEIGKCSRCDNYFHAGSDCLIVSGIINSLSESQYNIYLNLCLELAMVKCGNGDIKLVRKLVNDLSKYLNQSKIINCTGVDNSIFEDTTSSDEYIKVWQCKYCDKTFDTKQGATYHEMKYCKCKDKSKKYKCTCGKSYDSYYGLNMHKQKWCRKY